MVLLFRNKFHDNKLKIKEIKHKVQWVLACFLLILNQDKIVHKLISIYHVQPEITKPEMIILDQWGLNQIIVMKIH